MKTNLIVGKVLELLKDNFNDRFDKIERHYQPAAEFKKNLCNVIDGETEFKLVNNSIQGDFSIQIKLLMYKTTIEDCIDLAEEVLSLLLKKESLGGSATWFSPVSLNPNFDTEGIDCSEVLLTFLYSYRVQKRWSREVIYNLTGLKPIAIYISTREVIYNLTGFYVSTVNLQVLTRFSDSDVIFSIESYNP